LPSGKLSLRYTGEKLVYHDPCELGRGSGIYEEPRRVLGHIAELNQPGAEREMALCCGGSLANLTISRQSRRDIADSTSRVLLSAGAGAIATGCPLCKKTFTQVSEKPVRDLAEIVAGSFYDGSTIKESVKIAHFTEA
jgi:Fe-S oxidoreductase